MFNLINNENEINEILDGLSKDIINNIFESDPLLGILIIDCFLKRGGKTPIPSVVSSKLINMSFYYWGDISNHLNKYLNNEDFSKKVSDINKFERSIFEISRNEKQLFCFAEALFIESQMKVFSQSPYPVQEVVNNLSLPIFEDKEIFRGYDSPIPSNMSNAQIYITLHFGKTLFVQVNYPELTIQNWMNELEAGIALTIPQLIDSSINNLEEPENILLKEIIRNEFYSWNIKKPEIAENRKWSWLTYLDDLENEPDKIEFNENDTNSRINESVLNLKHYSNRLIMQEEKETKQSYGKYFLKGALFGLGVTFLGKHSLADYIGYSISNIFIFGAIGYSILVFMNKDFKKLWTSLIFLLLAFIVPMLLFSI